MFRFISLLALLTATPLQAQTLETAGVVASETRAMISAQVAAPIVELPFRAGDAFAQGDRLVTLDCGRERADLKEAQANHDGAAAQLAMKSELLSYDAIGKAEVDVAAAEAEAALARMERLMAVISDCTVDAPFSGRVVERLVNLYETPALGDQLLTLIDDDALEIEILAPSQWLQWLEVGQVFSFEIRETGANVQARIARIGAAVDPVSQSIDLIGHFVGPVEDTLPGMSGRALFDRASN